MLFKKYFIPTQETGQSCDILKAAIDRYNNVLRRTHLILSKYSTDVLNQATDLPLDTNFKGEVQKLQINLKYPCERYPHLDMDEKCKFKCN